ncbi:unnamed protein product [Cuscuta epithymum]|uniref:Uncharacterized protein n=1 Tax=Cuscuta epithymum TaxID=186058 RepID=A0AAV0C0W3_9ASTE|nr:unnamed protein product [Cuscuta epithymum]
MTSARHFHISDQILLPLHSDPITHKSHMIIHQKNDKFFSRLISKEERSSSSSSLRFFYYGDSSKGSVPFRWESQPGTPKHALSSASLPPLTPPPSYQSSAGRNLKSAGGGRSSSRSNNLSFPFSFPSFSSKKTNNTIAPSLSSSSCSSSFSLPPSTPREDLAGRDDDARASCFGGRRGAADGGKISKNRRGRLWLCLKNVMI